MAYRGTSGPRCDGHGRVRVNICEEYRQTRVSKVYSGGFEKCIRAISQLRPHNYALSIFGE